MTLSDILKNAKTSGKYEYDDKIVSNRLKDDNSVEPEQTLDLDDSDNFL